MRGLRSLAPLVMLATFSGGCSKTNSTPSPRADGAVATAIAGSTPTADARTITITARDYAYTGLPTGAPAGWLTFRMVNAGREPHMFSVARVPAGYTAAQIIDSIAHNGKVPDLPDWGGPNVVSAGDTASATLDFPAGNYVVGCAVVSADGKTHMMKGMMGSFSVVASADTAAPARGTESVITLTDYHVALTGAPLGTGMHAIRVHDGAGRSHDLEILKIASGHTVAEALAWFEHPSNLAPAATAIGGVSAIHAGQDAIVTANFTPGSYVFACWVPDDKGQPHYHRGMIQIVTIRAA